MASKKLETEFLNLKKEFVGLQELIQNLLEKHGDLEKKYERYMLKQRKNNFRCRNCGDRFDILRHLQEHKEKGCSSDRFQCDECEMCFKDEQKLQDHKEKKHVKFECDDCGIEFRYEII